MINRRILLALGVCLVSLTTLHAQDASPSPLTRSTSELSSKPFDPAEATRAWLATVPADKRAKADAYFESGHWLILWNFLLAAAISTLLLQSRISARLRNFAERVTRFKALQVALYAVPSFAIVALLSFPLDIYQGCYREHQYGMATQTFGPWLADQLKAFLVLLIVGCLALVILYAVFRRAPRTWPVWGKIGAVCLSIFETFVAPVFVEPLFNPYKPLDDPKILE